ncbi:MAG TPA: hypothetical protein VF733_02395 [Candidatus Saccharimonadales bacterium]
MTCQQPHQPRSYPQRPHHLPFHANLNIPKDQLVINVSILAVEGHQSMDQMFERAQYAFPMIFKVAPMEQIMSQPPRFQRLTLPEGPMVGSFKAVRSSRVA